MTSRQTEREAIVDELLLDAGLADASDVRQTLVSLGTFANLPAPAPSPELAAMIAGPHDELSKRRWRHQHRTAVVSIAVVAAMGLGVSGVAAASSGFTRNPSFIDQLISNFHPRPSVAAPELPSNDAPRVTTEPAPAADPAAIPPASDASSIPVPAPATADNVAQAQAQAQAPDAAPAVPTPKPADAVPADTFAAQPGAADASAAQPRTAKPNKSLDGAAQEPQAQGNQLRRQGADAPKPEASKADTGKPAKPGLGSKQGALLPPLSDKRTDEQLQPVMDKWKKWLKQGHR
ncbi:hypothetical protein [Paenarthrobacter sp. NPDC091669]|uniref:hypothetical protein n=1 Tax=Paenarthrobacter sp. NPDC091669 TaxID=3364384 RepID=UPI0037F2904B